MKIVYISPNFEINSDPGSDRYHYTLKHLAKQGHQVTVISSSVAYKLANIRPECKGRLKTEVMHESIKIIYLWSYPHIRGSFFRRFIYLLSYMSLAVLFGLFLDRPDVIYAPNSPGMVGYTGYLLSRLRRIPFVFEVADVWPDAGIAMGMMTNTILISLTRGMEMACYHHAEKIIALTQGIKENIQKKGIPAEKLVLITNGVDPLIFEEIDPNRVATIKTQLGTDYKFTGVYLGAHGHYNSLWTIIEAAECLSKDPRFAFVLIGDGDYKPVMHKMVREKDLRNVFFWPPVPRSDSVNFLAVADFFLLPNRRGDFFRMNLPNKLFDFLASGRPVIVAGEGESANVVLAARAGLVVPAEDYRGMADAIQALAGMSEAERKKMGERGRAYVFNNFNRKKQSQLIDIVLTNAALQKKVLA